MSRFSRRIETYQDVFPSSDASAVQPEDVSEVVELQHPFIPHGARFLEVVVETVTGGAGAEFANFPIVPSDRFWWVSFWHISHNDPAGARIQWELEERNLGAPVIIESIAQQADGANLNPNQIAGLRRPILILPGWRAVAGSGSAIAAGQFIFSTLVRIEYPLAENAPPY